MENKKNSIKNCRTQMRKGVNFIEIIIVAAIIGIIAAVGVKLFSPLPSMLETGQTEFNLQSRVKAASETIVNEVRYSTAVFILPEASFTQDKLTNGWNYIGIENVDVNGSSRKEVVQYSWNGTSHDRKVLVEAQEDLFYNLEFATAKSKPKKTQYSEDQLVYLTFEAVTADGTSAGRNMEIDTAVKALNSLQIVDHSSNSDIGRAVAYSSIDRDLAIEDGIVPGRISMILDLSGSMAWPFSGGVTKIQKLKSVTKDLLNQFYNSGADISINFIPFADEANDTRKTYGDGQTIHTFKSVRNDNDKMQKMIDKLKATGMTNTGDGIRRSYHSLYNAAESDTQPMPNYVILVVDGDSNYFTRKSLGKNRPNNYYIEKNKNLIQFVYKDGNANNNNKEKRTPLGMPIYEDKDRFKYPHDYANEYVSEMGQQLVNNLTAHPKVSELRCFLVAVQMESTEGLITIKNALNIAEEDYFVANDAIELEAAFTIITKSIIEDPWFVYGPQI